MMLPRTTVALPTYIAKQTARPMGDICNAATVPFDAHSKIFIALSVSILSQYFMA